MARKMTPLLGTLFGEGRATVVGLPPSFDLLKELRSAQRISLATAFAHASGWKLLSGAIRESKATLRLVAGIDFCQTEPRVLTDWLRLTASRSGSSASIGRADSGVFHPKVILVESAQSRFAIVGSGNLSAGGLRDNAECSIFVDSPTAVAHVRQWFDDLLADDVQVVLLNERMIADYTPRHERARKALAKVREQQRGAESSIVDTRAMVLGRWKQAVKAARAYFASKKCKDDRKDRSGAANEIRTLLHSPRFDFTSQEWRDFYAIKAYGRLIELNREGPLKRKARLQAGFRHLVDSRVPAVDRLNALLEPAGRFHVSGVGINIVSKVLATHDPQSWAVFNKPVESVLSNFAARPVARQSRGERYLSFCLAMQELRDATGAKNLLDLDLFFVHKYHW